MSLSLTSPQTLRVFPLFHLMVIQVKVILWPEIYVWSSCLLWMWEVGPHPLQRSHVPAACGISGGNCAEHKMGTSLTFPRKCSSAPTSARVMVGAHAWPQLTTPPLCSGVTQRFFDPVPCWPGPWLGALADSSSSSGSAELLTHSVALGQASISEPQSS